MQKNHELKGNASIKCHSNPAQRKIETPKIFAHNNQYHIGILFN